jgi:hypothetical protein
VDLHFEKCVKISGYVIHGAEVKTSLATEYAVMFQGEGAINCPIGTAEAPSDKIIAERA